MLGAILGDIVGSRFEFCNHSGKDFVMFTDTCHITDDTLMTLAVAKALLLCKGDYNTLNEKVEKYMKQIANKYPDVGWGLRFYNWVFNGKELKDSYGNGAAMRISPVGWVADSEQEVKFLSKTITETTHGHPEGLKGAEAIAMAVYWARTGKDKQFMRNHLAEYYKELKYSDFTIDRIMEYYGYDDNGNWVTCQGSVPYAIEAFLESTSFEDAIFNAVGIGGDSDTIGAMAGSIAEAYYGVSIKLEDIALSYMPEDLKNIYYAFDTIKKQRVKK